MSSCDRSFRLEVSSTLFVYRPVYELHPQAGGKYYGDISIVDRVGVCQV